MEKEKQKEVKIIGLKINQQLGILQSCNLSFDPNNKLIAIKGVVGSGKTTIQKAISLGTKGADTLKDDKQLYGVIDEEVQLLDGDTKIFVGLKSEANGSLDYVIYTKDETGKIVKNPEIDGVKITPSSYLKSLQTSLTWRMDELMSENPTVQKKLLLEVFRTQLAGLGVVFDKKDNNWNGSILGKIEEAEEDRKEKEFLRKQVGGFLNQLEPLGIDPENSDTYPVFTDLTASESLKVDLNYKIKNVDQVRASELDKLKNQADSVINDIKAADAKIIAANKKTQDDFLEENKAYSKVLDLKTAVETSFSTLPLKEGGLEILSKTLSDNFISIPPVAAPLKGSVQYDSVSGSITSKSEHFPQDSNVFFLLGELEMVRKEYKTKHKEPKGSTEELDSELVILNQNIEIIKENNNRRKMLDSFLKWQEANFKVVELRNDYANLLSGINTGVDGLQICIDKDESSKLDIYLKYNGAYDPVYFGNKDKEFRKLSSYSGTQKPLICLLLQNYLLSEKPKAMRYLWIDDVPIDNKTKALLGRMGEELGVTIIVNITGDFEKSGLQDGELLIEGGEVFFN
jgi:hypothetical protein